jgi:hypothetical protein
MALKHHITPEHQEELRSGTVTWNDRGDYARCGHMNGWIQWSESRIGWKTSQMEEWQWIDTHLAVVNAKAVERYEAIARRKVEDKLRAIGQQISREILDSPDYEYQPITR